jgi:hypothetical protein
MGVLLEAVSSEHLTDIYKDMDKYNCSIHTKVNIHTFEYRLRPTFNANRSMRRRLECRFMLLLKLQQTFGELNTLEQASKWTGRLARCDLFMLFQTFYETLCLS